MYKAWFAKIEECDNCGERLSIKQKYCPNCGVFNPDYRQRNWTGDGIEEIERENEENQERENLTK